MQLTEEIIEFIKEKEGLRLNAYLCPAKVWTIGYGNTFYENGMKVKQGDKITKERAEQLLLFVLNQFADKVKPLIKSKINNNQFSALVSFAYNVGIGALQKSTLLKKVNNNPNDLTIKNEFLKWTRAKGVILTGLIKRRDFEQKIYFKVISQ